MCSVFLKSGGRCIWSYTDDLKDSCVLALVSVSHSYCGILWRLPWDICHLSTWQFYQWSSRFEGTSGEAEMRHPEWPAIWTGRWRHQCLHPAIGSMQIRARSSSCDILIQVGPEEFTFIVSMLWLVPKSWIPQWHWCLRWSLQLPSVSAQSTQSRISKGLFNKHIKKSMVARAIQGRSICKGTLCSSHWISM